MARNSVVRKRLEVFFILKRCNLFAQNTAKYRIVQIECPFIWRENSFETKPKWHPAINCDLECNYIAS